MSAFGFLKNFARKPEKIHPVFGRIVYQDEGIWECGRVNFQPLKKDVEVLIHAGPEGPSEPHLEFLAELSRRWPELLKASEPLLRRALVDWIKHPEQGDIWSRLSIEGLDVFERILPDQEWEFIFWSEEAGHFPTVLIKGWTPIDVMIDG